MALDFDFNFSLPQATADRHMDIFYSKKLYIDIYTSKNARSKEMFGTILVLRF